MTHCMMIQPHGWRTNPFWMSPFTSKKTSVYHSKLNWMLHKHKNMSALKEESKGNISASMRSCKDANTHCFLVEMCSMVLYFSACPYVTFFFAIACVSTNKLFASLKDICILLSLVIILIIIAYIYNILYSPVGIPWI